MNSKYNLEPLLKSIESIRDHKGISLQTLSYMTGIDLFRLEQIEHSFAMPSLEELQNILDALDCHLEIFDNQFDDNPLCLKDSRSRRKTVFVVGNGFDKSLGMKTLYKEFIESHFWPFNEETIHDTESGKTIASPLADFIRSSVNCRAGNWSDLEGTMRRYCIDRFDEQVRSGIRYSFDEQDRIAFKILSSSLRGYLRSEQNRFFSDEEMMVRARRSWAGHILHDILHSGDEVLVHSFNYTDIEKIAYRLDVEDTDLESMEEWSGHSCWCSQVHATVYSKSIVLGVEEDCPMPDSLSFLRKVNNPGFMPTTLLRDLKDCDSVVFFGHSLGIIDQCYFRDFFLEQSRPGTKSKEITIYTFNEESGNAVLSNLKSMEGVDLLHLMADNNFSIQYTSQPICGPDANIGSSEKPCVQA